MVIRGRDVVASENLRSPSVITPLKGKAVIFFLGPQDREVDRKTTSERRRVSPNRVRSGKVHFSLRRKPFFRVAT